MMHRNTLSLAALGALALTAACGNNDNNTTAPQPQVAHVRIVNLDPSSSTAGLYSNGTLFGSNVGFGAAAASCIDVPVGQSLSFRAGGSGTDIGANATPGFVAGQNYTVVLYRSGSTAQSAVLSDNNITAPGTGQNALRFFNATGTAGDIYVTSNGATISGTPSASGLGAGASTTGTGMWTAYPSTSTQIRMFNTGTTTGTPRVNTSFTSANLSSSRAGTAFLTESNMTGTSTNASVVAAPCT
jgi:hypothetical protein